MTNANGAYSIANVPAGDRTIREVLQPGWVASNPATGEQVVSTTVAFPNRLGVDFGNYQFATVSGIKWSDLDNDAVFDGGESGVGNFIIYVDLDNDGFQDAGEPTDTSDAAGNYSITNVPPGTHRVREVPKAGWVQTFPAAGFHTVAFTSGTAFGGLDFGNHQLLSLVVTNVNNAGVGSLRAAVDAANSAAGPDTIVFDIPGAGPHAIQLAAVLPVLVDAATLEIAGPDTVEIGTFSAFSIRQNGGRPRRGTAGCGSRGTSSTAPARSSSWKTAS